jgi:hypothetical protein
MNCQAVFLMGVTSPKAWAIGFIDTLMTPNTWNGPFDYSP